MTGSTEGVGRGIAGGGVTARGIPGAKDVGLEFPICCVGLMICRVLPAPLLRISGVMKSRITLIRVGRPTRLAQTWICSMVWPK